MTTAVTSNIITETPDDENKDHDSFISSIVTSLFRSLAHTAWTHELWIENATTVNLPTTGHGFCSLISREATKIKGQVDPAGSVEEMLLHENGDYKVEGGDQAAIFKPSLLWSRSFVWRMDLTGSSLITVRPQVEKRRRSSVGRKGSIFSRRSIATSDASSQENESAWRHVSIQSAEAQPQKRLEEVSTWRRISVAIGRRESKAVALDESRPLQDKDGVNVHSGVKTEEPKYSARKDLHIPQIDIYATKPQTRKMSFHLHTLKFDLQPDVWSQRMHNLEDIPISAHGAHFTGEERYGIKYEFLMRCEAPKGDNRANGQYYVQQWKTVEVVRGPAGKDKTTTTCYGRSPRGHLAAKPHRT